MEEDKKSGGGFLGLIKLALAIYLLYLGVSILV